MPLSPAELSDINNLAIRAAKQAGGILLNYAQKGFSVHHKNQSINLVTEADLHAEQAIIDLVQETFPQHQILSEEQGLKRASGHGTKWIIDPLDGTTNFAHGFPMYNVSIGIEHEESCIMGVVYDPTRHELFHALQGQGATLNGIPIRVSRTPRLHEALLVTGFAYDVHTARDNNLKEFCEFSLQARGMRRTGTAAIDLCYIACGRFDGFWELQLNPWDTAAGTVIVKEAGGIVTNYAGGPYSIYDNTIIATNGHIHQEMVDVLQKVRGC